MLKAILFGLMLPAAAHAHWECQFASSLILLDISGNRFKENGDEWQPLGFVPQQPTIGVAAKDIIFWGQEFTNRPYRTFVLTQGDQDAVRLFVETSSDSKSVAVGACNEGRTVP